jgi:hypothetical protein
MSWETRVASTIEAIAIVNSYLLHIHECKARSLPTLSFHYFKLKLIGQLLDPNLRSQLSAASPQMEPVAAEAEFDPFQGHVLAPTSDIVLEPGAPVPNLQPTCSEPQCHGRHRSYCVKCYEIEGQIRTFCTVKSEKSDGRCWNKHLAYVAKLG